MGRLPGGRFIDLLSVCEMHAARVKFLSRFTLITTGHGPNDIFAIERKRPGVGTAPAIEVARNIQICDPVLTNVSSCVA